ncbi:MAG: hypothetical protein ACPG5P_03740, partial [Saprospiraceae bacterium]
DKFKKRKKDRQNGLLISKQDYSFSENNETYFWDNLKKGIEEGSIIVKNEEGAKVDNETFLDLSRSTYHYKGINSETREEETLTSFSARSYRKAFDFNIIWYYDKKENSFSTIIKSIEIPSYKGGNLIVEYPLDGEVFSIDNNDCPLGRVVYVKDGEFTDAILIKGKTEELFKQLLYDDIKNGKQKVFSDFSRNNWTEIDIFVLDSVSVDTFVSFNPDTYEEVVEVEFNKPVDWSKTPRLGFDMEFMWDNSRKRIFCRLLAIGPMQDSYIGEPIKIYRTQRYKIAN